MYYACARVLGEESTDDVRLKGKLGLDRAICRRFVVCGDLIDHYHCDTLYFPSAYILWTSAYVVN